MSATIPQQRTLLGQLLGQVVGLEKVYLRWPSKTPAMPSAVIGSPDISFRTENGNFFHRATWPIYILTGAVEQKLEAAQALLDGFMADSGVGSVRAIVADPLAGAVENLWIEVTGWKNYGTHTVDGVEYVGAVLDVGITYGPDELDLGL